MPSSMPAAPRDALKPTIVHVLVAALTFVASLLALTQTAFAQGVVVRTDGGALRGSVANGIASFKGIPYAAPPVGELRWREPQPARRWSDIRSADRIGNACIQKPGLSAANGGDPGPLGEDCLYLNVWSPRAERSAKLPVIVWIHGGAYIFGSGAVRVYDGVPMAKKGIVFVTVNYRLGPLGFFAHPVLEKDRPGGPANFGLLDQLAALRWVKTNIAGFGGNPEKVTIMGQSAGGKSVLAHMASPLSRGLFNKAIVLSSYIVPDAKRQRALEVGSQIATAVGLDGERASLERLRRVPAQRFGDIKDKDASFGPVPIEGDEMLPRSIASTFGAGGEAAVPLMLGNTSDDGSVAVVLGFDPESIMKRLGPAGIALKLLYPGSSDNAEIGRQVLRDAAFSLPVHWIADRHAKRAPTWRYYFAYTQVRDRPQFPHGVPHGDDIAYFLDTGAAFSNGKRPFGKRDFDYARTVSSYVAAFARTGEPTSSSGPEWQSDKFLRDRTMVFGNDRIGLERNFMKARLDILKAGVSVVERLFAK